MKCKRTFSLLLIIMASLTVMLTGCSGTEKTDGDKTTGGEQKAAETKVAEKKVAEKKVDFPNKRIEIIIPAGAGGGSDNFARAVGQELSEILGVPVNNVYFPGGSGHIGLQEQNNRPADGYTLQAVTSTIQTENALGKTKEPEKIKGLSLFHEDTYSFHVKADSKYKDIDTLITEAKANPGKIKVGGTYPMSLDEIVVRKFEKATGVKLNYVPYSETGKMQADILGGHIDVMIDEFPPSMELIKANKIKPLIVFAKDRIKAFPDVPTSVEKGINFTDGQLRGFILHSDTPQEIVDILEDALEKAYKTERYQKYAADNLLNLKEVFAGSKDYDALLRKQSEEYKALFAEMKK